MAVLASFTTPIERRPGSACEEITFVLRKKSYFFGLIDVYTVERIFMDYINLFEMSNGEEGQIGRCHDVMHRFARGDRALDHFMDLQFMYNARGGIDGSPL